MFKNSVKSASCCFLYVKDTNLKANHNDYMFSIDEINAVSYMSKILI